MGWFCKKKELKWPKPKEKHFSSNKVVVSKRKVNINLKSGKSYQFIITPTICEINSECELFPGGFSFSGGYDYYKIDYKKYNDLYVFKYKTKDVSYDGPAHFDDPFYSNRLEFGTKENKFIINTNEIESLQVEELEKIEYTYDHYWT